MPYLLIVICHRLARGLTVVNGDDRKIGYYIGALQSANAAMTAISVLGWGCFSDSCGRKSAFVLCLTGMALASTLFGFGSSSFGWFLGFQMLEGMFRAAKPTVKAALSDIASSNRVGTQTLARLLSFMPPVYALGSSISPLVSGVTVSRLDQSHLPYFIPCALAGAVCFAALFGVVSFFVEVSISSTAVQN